MHCVFPVLGSIGGQQKELAGLLTPACTDMQLFGVYRIAQVNSCTCNANEWCHGDAHDGAEQCERTNLEGQRLRSVRDSVHQDGRPNSPHEKQSQRLRTRDSRSNTHNKL